MSNELKVSISCITFNHEKYIRDALDSFLMQKVNFKYEILIHDDASSDRTQEIVKEYESKYPEIIKPIYQVENKYTKGERIAYKYNVSRAKGEYIAFCEGDDYWSDPNKLQIQIDFMEKNPNCGMCFHSMENIDAKSGKTLYFSRPSKQSRRVYTEEIIEGGGNIVGSNTMLYRTKYMKNPPSYYFDSHVGDFPIQIYLSTKNYAYFIDRVMSVHRVNVPGSWTEKNLSGKNITKKRIINYKRDIELLKNINEYYNGKFNYSISKAISERHCYSRILSTNYLSFRKSPEYQIFKGYAFTKRIKMFLHAYFPKTYRLMQFLKRHFNKEQQ